MVTRNAGTASIRIKPDATQFVADLKRDLAAKQAEFVMRVSADTGQARADIDRFREVQQRNGLNVGVDVALGQAQADMAAFRARQRSDGLVVKVDADTGKAQLELAALRAEMTSLGSLSSAAKLNFGVAGVAGIQPAVAGLAQVAAGLQQVMQAGIAVPGVIAGVVASIGTLAFGVSGISDAYKAVSSAADSAGADQAASARTATAASNSLRNAIVDEASARRDAARAAADQRRELRDLVLEQRGGMLDESRAILEAQKAREDLARGNFSDIRDASLRVAEADQRVLEVRARNVDTVDKLSEANAKGVAGSDKVVAANERVTRSQQQVADAQAAVTASGTSVGSAQDKANKAMAALGPSAQNLVKTFVALKPAFQDFRTSVSEPLLKGKAEELQKFFTTLQPTLTKGMSGIAGGLNQNISALVGSVGSDEGKGLIDRILGNTGDAQGRLSAAMDPLVKGLGTLTAAGTDALPRMAEGLTKVLERFRTFITEADQDGRLNKWINDGLDGLTNLGNSVLNIGKSFAAITKASGGGRSFTEWLEDATGRLQTFLNSGAGQNKLQQYFAEGRDVIREVVPLLKELPGALAAVGEGAATYIGGILPLLTQAAKLMGDHPELVKTAVAAYIAFNTIKPIIGALNSGVGVLNSGLIGLGTGFQRTRDQAAKAMGDVDGVFVKAGKDGSGLNKFTRGVSALGAVGGPIAILASVAIPGLIAGLGYLDQANKQSAQVTKDLQTAQESLETTVDRVTGKLTAQTRGSLISQAQGYDASGRPGGGIPGISKGDALAAASSLGIKPDVYADALEGNPEAVNAVRDVLKKNNLLPEFQANKDLGKRASAISAQTGGAIDQNLLFSALLGDPKSLEQYNAVLADKAKGNPSLMNTADLQEIAKSLSKTGQASVLAGGALGFLNQALPGLGGPTQQANQANYGSFSINPDNTGPFSPANQVGSSGSDYKVVVPGDMAAKLDAAGIPYTKNSSDGTLTATLPLDSPFVKRQYKQGSRGMTPGGRDQGFMAELHGKEWVHDADTVQRYSPEVMNAMWRGQIDPKALRSLVPGFQTGGPTDPNDPNYVGHAGTGAAPGPAPVAPNPYQGGGIPGVIEGVAQGAATVASQVSQLPNQMAPPGNSFTTGLAAGLGIPNLGGQMASPGPGWGPEGPPIGLGGGPDGFDIRKFGIGPGPAGSGPNDWLNFTGKTLGKLGSDVAKTLGKGALDSVGAGGVLQSPYVAGAGQIATHFADANKTASAGAASPGPMDVDALVQSAAASGVTLTPETLSALYGGLGGVGGTGGAVTGDTGGLQINTARGKAMIQQKFPWATNIGGVRADALKWHPSGLALDVMIPGAGGLNDPTPAAGKAEGDQLYAWLNAHKQELGIDYILWQEKDHFNHLHVNFAASGYPDGSGPAAGAPAGGGGKGITPVTHDWGGTLQPGLTLVNNATRKPETVLPPAESQALKTIAKQGTVTPPPPRPDFSPGAGINKINPPATAPQQRQRQPGAATTPGQPQLPAPGQDSLPAPSAPPAGPTQGTPPPTPTAGVAPAPSSTTHTLPWVDQAITSGFATAGSIAQQAASMGMMAATMGGSAVAGGGGMGGGMGGISISGMFQQAGKVASGVANVISSAMVGSVPGSSGDPNKPAYGQINMPEQRRPATAEYAGSGGSKYYISGHDTRDVMQMANNHEALERQAILATRRG